MSIKKHIISTTQLIRWSMDCLVCRKRIPNRQLQSCPSGKIIVLMPHADDEWIGCSQLLINKTQEALVINLDMGGGDVGLIHIERRKESENLARKYNYQFRTLSESSKEAELCSILKEYQPTCVFLPSFFDWHNEHFETMRIFSNAADYSSYNNKVGLYQVSVPIPAQLINSGTAMSKKQLKNKWDIFRKQFLTQNNIPIRRFAINEIINGGICGKYAFEAYSINNFCEWSHNYKMLSFNDCEKVEIRNNINNIKTVRSICEKHVQRVL